MTPGRYRVAVWAIGPVTEGSFRRWATTTVVSSRTLPVAFVNGLAALVDDSLELFRFLCAQGPGCALQHGAFETGSFIHITPPDEALIFFIIRLIERLRAMGNAPPWT